MCGLLQTNATSGGNFMHFHHDHLVRRSNGTFHFRLVLPASLSRSLGKKEVHHSLKTKKKRVAIPRANQLYRTYMDMKKEEEALFYNIYLKLADGTKVEIDHETPEQELKTAQALLSTGSSPSAIGMDLTDLIDAYLTDTKNGVTPRTQTERRGALSAFLSLYDTIDHTSANGFSDTLKRLPPGFKKDDIKELANQSHDRVLSPKTHNKYIGFLSAFNTWLMRRGHLNKNYFSGLVVKKTTQSHKERDPYEPEEIKLLLDGITDLSGFKYWLPRLGLYTGCRLNELCQLYMDDVDEVDGILSLKIQEGNEGQHLKNLSSERIVPLHPDMADDFNEYLKTVDNVRVFPELTYTDKSYWGGLASKWFGRYRKTIGLNKTFHSLRHTFASNLQANGVDSRIISELLGHAQVGETARYTGKRPVGQLLDAIKALKF